jgi:hypothetical protein
MAFYATDTCPEVADLPSKNRVGGSRPSSPLRAGRSMPQAFESVSETTVTVTIIVSGMSFWLSRDPIGEVSFQAILGVRSRPLPRSDANLYLFVRNMPSGLIDPLGLDVQPPVDPHYPHPDEGKPCCCGAKPCSVEFSADAIGSGLKIKVQTTLKSEGCCSDFHTQTWTCSYGSQQCWDTPLNEWFWPIVQGDYVYVHTYVSYLSCSGNPGTWNHQYKMVSHICERSLLGGWSCQ